MSQEICVGHGAFRFEACESWLQVPSGWDLPVTAVSADREGRVFVFTRSPERPVIVASLEGHVLDVWGRDCGFRTPHAIRADRHGHLWIVDRDLGQVLVFSGDGRLLRSFGERGFRSETGVKPDDFGPTTHLKVRRAAEPFNLPTDVCVADNGDFYVSDGYANSRVHHFSSEGKLIRSWGAPGSAPGEFLLPHGVIINSRTELLVCDRENDRIQVFDLSGKFLRVWSTKLGGPAAICLDTNDNAYVAEHNSGQVHVLDAAGESITQFGAGRLTSCHGVTLDPDGDLYVAQPVRGSTGRSVVKYRRLPTAH